MASSAIRFSPECTVPVAKRVGADLLEFAAPESSDFVSVGNFFKTAAKSLGRQNLREQLSSCSRKREGAFSGKELAYGKQAGKVVATKSAKQTSRSRRDIFSNIFLTMSTSFRYQIFVAVSWKLGRNSQ